MVPRFGANHPRNCPTYRNNYIFGQPTTHLGRRDRPVGVGRKNLWYKGGKSGLTKMAISPPPSEVLSATQADTGKRSQRWNAVAAEEEKHYWKPPDDAPGVVTGRGKPQYVAELHGKLSTGWAVVLHFYDDSKFPLGISRRPTNNLRGPRLLVGAPVGIRK